jgi:hypothetical protein
LRAAKISRGQVNEETTNGTDRTYKKTRRHASGSATRAGTEGPYDFALVIRVIGVIRGSEFVWMSATRGKAAWRPSVVEDFSGVRETRKRVFDSMEKCVDIYRLVD